MSYVRTTGASRRAARIASMRYLHISAPVIDLPGRKPGELATRVCVCRRYFPMRGGPRGTGYVRAKGGR